MGQPKSKDTVVVFDHILQSCEPTVMIKPALGVAPESGKRRRTVHMGRRPVRLERIHTDFARSVKVVPWLREKRRHMASGSPTPVDPYQKWFDYEAQTLPIAATVL